MYIVHTIQTFDHRQHALIQEGQGKGNGVRRGGGSDLQLFLQSQVTVKQDGGFATGGGGD